MAIAAGTSGGLVFAENTRRCHTAQPPSQDIAMSTDSLFRTARRSVLRRLTGLGLAACAVGAANSVLAQGVRKRLATKLKIVIPGGARSNLDEAGRALGDSLVVLGLCDEIEYENHDGKGGALAPTYYAGKYAQDPDALLLADTSQVGAMVLHAPAVDLSRFNPIARLTSDYPVVVVRANSPIKTAADLAMVMKTAAQTVRIGIGSLGGVDHVVAGLLAQAAGSSLAATNFVPFARNFELVDALAGNSLTVAVSGYRTFGADVASGRLRALGVSSRKSAYGLRPLREQGLNVDLANWRAVFTGAGVSKSRQAEMVEALRSVVNDESWKKTLRQNYWDAAWLVGPDLVSALDIDIRTLQLAVQLLNLKM